MRVNNINPIKVNNVNPLSVKGTIFTYKFSYIDDVLIFEDINTSCNQERAPPLVA